MPWENSLNWPFNKGKQKVDRLLKNQKKWQAQRRFRHIDRWIHGLSPNQLDYVYRYASVRAYGCCRKPWPVKLEVNKFLPTINNRCGDILVVVLKQAMHCEMSPKGTFLFYSLTIQAIMCCVSKIEGVTH